MNQLPATIKKITSSSHLTLIEATISQYIIKILVIDAPKEKNYLHQGNDITLLFKETEIIIATANVLKDTSVPNVLPGTIAMIEQGEILTKIEIEFCNFLITAIITTDAFINLQLKEKQLIYWLLKANEITILEK